MSHLLVGLKPCARVWTGRIGLTRAAVGVTGPGRPLRLGSAVSQDMHLQQQLASSIGHNLILLRKA